MTPPLAIAVVHLDESCLGNGQEGKTPGGAGGLIETATRGGVQRRDFFLHAADTTNNRMALAGGIAALQLLAGKGQRMRVLLVSDSEYLVKGMREWVPAWKASPRGPWATRPAITMYSVPRRCSTTRSPFRAACSSWS